MEEKWPEITKDTPIEEVQAIHKRIWQYVIDHDFEKPDTPYFSDCAPCEYDEQFDGDCRHCPAGRPIGSYEDICFVHDLYIGSTSDSIRREYAVMIRDWEFYTKEGGSE